MCSGDSALVINRLTDIQLAYETQTGQRLPANVTTRALLRAAAIRSIDLQMCPDEFVTLALEGCAPGYHNANALSGTTLDARVASLIAEGARLIEAYPGFAGLPPGQIYLALSCEAYWHLREQAEATRRDIRDMLRDKFEPIPAWLRVLETDGQDHVVNQLFLPQLREEVSKYGNILDEFVTRFLRLDPWCYRRLV